MKFFYYNQKNALEMDFAIEKNSKFWLYKSKQIDKSLTTPIIPPIGIEDTDINTIPLILSCNDFSVIFHSAEKFSHRIAVVSA